jgi:hypothetical protein
LVFLYREIFSNPSSIELKEIATWLIQAFLRSWDVPIILQEVILFILVYDSFYLI